MVKCSWVPARLLNHEAEVLHHLNSQGVSRIPELVGSLKVADELVNACDSTSGWLEHLRSEDGWTSSLGGLKLATVVTRCPIGEQLNENTSLTDILRVFQDLGRTIRQIAQAGVVCRDINLDNVLLNPSPSASSSSSCLLVDFSNARFQDCPRGNLPRPFNITDFAADESNTASEYYRCTSSCKAGLSLARIQRSQVGVEHCLALAELQPDDPRRDAVQEAIDLFLESVADACQELASHVHRPIDDLEAAAWALVYLVSHWRWRY